MTLTLYYSPNACSLAPHIVLEEIGASYRLERASVRDGTTQSAEFRAVNPKGRVPVLHGVEGSGMGPAGVLTEAPAILLYLARSHPQAGLLPASPIGEARCLEWLNWLSSNVHAMTYGQIWRAGRFVADTADEPPVIAKGQQAVREQYAYIEQILADGRTWAVAGTYSVVDPFLFVFHRWGERVDVDMTAYPAWGRLTQRLLQRPAVQRALKQEGLLPQEPQAAAG